MLNSRNYEGRFSRLDIWRDVFSEIEESNMRFGITIKPDMTVERIVALTRQAEASGFEYGCIFDSHVLWLEPYPMLTLMATNTKAGRKMPTVATVAPFIPPSR